LLTALVIFLLGILASLTFSLYFLRYLAEGRRLRAARITLVLFELGSVGGLFFLFSTHRTDGWAGLVTLPIILLLVAQMIVLALVVGAVLIRFFLRKVQHAPYDAARRRVLKNAALYPAAGGPLRPRRAGRAGFDTVGFVRVLAPEHEVDAARERARLSAAQEAARDAREAKRAAKKSAKKRENQLSM